MELEVGFKKEFSLTPAALTALQAKKALDKRPAGTTGAPGKADSTRESCS